MARATFAAQVQDGIEATFRKIAGVSETRLGFLADPVCQGSTSAVEVRFDPSLTTFAELLEMYWRLCDPELTQPHLSDRPSSRAIVFYHDDDQRIQAIATRIRLERGGQLTSGLLTDILPATPWLDIDAMLPPGSAGAGSSAGQLGDD